MGVRRLTVYRLRGEEVLARGPDVPGVTVRTLSRQEISAYVAMRPDTPETEVTRRLRAGAECVTAWRDQRLVAARWRQSGRIEMPYLGVSVQLHPEVSYAYDAYTRPDERRRGVSAMVTAELVKSASRAGAKAVINAVLPENRGGGGLARGRSGPIGVLRSLRLGRWMLIQSRVPPGFFGAPAALGSG